MKYFIKTYGCQMNYSDSERIAGVLEATGYEKALSEDNADLIIINACSVRQSAINKISGRFKKYKKLKKLNPDLKIVLTGCVLESDRKKFEKLFDSVETDFVETRQCLVSTKTKPLRQSKFSAYVPIMTGCDNFCSYCVVPYTRGRENSRPAKEITNEVAELVERGYKEIILLGQNVNSYQSRIQTNLSSRAEQIRQPAEERSRGICQQIKCVPQLFLPKSKHFTPTDSSTPLARSSLAPVGMTEAINFPTLLKLLNNIPGDFWIRFLTSHPKDMSEELIKTVAECEKVTPYIHLALQLGDDGILKKMNRKYTAKHFLGLVKMIRKYLPDAAISTDIIIGFPGETEKQFQKTIEIMEKAKFDMAYLNKYSPRAGTAAAKLEDNISWTEKKRREKILTEVLRKTALENNERYVGKVVEVLVDEMEIKKLGNRDTGILFGKTKSFKNVKIKIGNWKLEINKNRKRYGNIHYHTESLIGKILKIKITQAGAWGLEGKIME